MKSKIIEKGNPNHIHFEKIINDCRILVGTCSCGRIKHYWNEEDNKISKVHTDGRRSTYASLLVPWRPKCHVCGATDPGRFSSYSLNNHKYKCLKCQREYTKKRMAKIRAG